MSILGTGEGKVGPDEPRDFIAAGAGRLLPALGAVSTRPRKEQVRGGVLGP